MLAYGGMERLLSVDAPPRKLKLRWVANALKAKERHAHYKRVLAHLSNLFAGAGLDMLVMKGLTVSALYPVQWYREGGDIDIRLHDGGGNCGDCAERGDRLMQSMGIEVHHSIAKHSIFVLNGLTVENHCRFFDTDCDFVREAEFYTRLERTLASTFTIDDCQPIGVGTVRGLPPRAAALFLVGHTFRHFCCLDLNVRQLCDWVVVFDRWRDQLDFELFTSQLRELGLDRFAADMNAFCAKWLGFDPPFLKGESGGGRGGRDGRSFERLLTWILSRYRLQRRFHIPVLGSLRHIARRNHIYNRYFGHLSPREFLLPELKRYFSWLAKRITGSVQ
jgi:hypothetical protein